jgi:uncharacterized protein YsxB (DUF464 family)
MKKRGGNKMSGTQTNTSRKLTSSIILAVILAILLCITTLALIYAMVRVDNNIFRTGKVEINLNDGEAIISENEFLFEPGMTVRKDFFIENRSTWSVYYRVYLDNIRGGLADIMEITVKDGDNIICSGIASDLTRNKVQAAEEMLQIGEKKNLSIYFHFPKDKGNEAKNTTLVFNLCADAVQTKNNPDRRFD